MKHFGRHRLGDFEKTFVVQGLKDTFLVTIQSGRGLVFKLSQDNQLQKVLEVSLSSDVVNVVTDENSLVFGLKNGLQVYSTGDWSLSTEIAFQNQVAFLKPLTEHNHKTTIALGIKNDSKFAVLLLQKLQVVSKIEFNEPVVNLVSDNEGYFNQIYRVLH